VKIWLVVVLLLLPGYVLAEDDTGATTDDTIDGWHADDPSAEGATGQQEQAGDTEENWVDASHSYASDQAQALTQWMDDYFGDPNYELEQAESLIRLNLTTDWDEEDGTNYQARLRGKLQLPKVSRRLNLVFRDIEGDELEFDEESRRLDDDVGLIYEVSEGSRSRLDLTMGLKWFSLRPGIRYRFQDSINDLTSYRLTQRVQWESDEGFYSTSQAELNRVLGENTILRSVNRVVYGEETDGVEWVTRLSLFQRTRSRIRNQRLGINYFGAINGVTDPDSYVKNYRLGVLYRRQIYRKFLFLELEPAYNYRKRNPHEKRQFAWSVALSLQIALERDLSRKNKKKRGEPLPDPADDNIGMRNTEDAGQNQLEPSPESAAL
jgi:hypothetical protein